MASQENILLNMPDINLPDPDPTIVSLYSHTIRDAHVMILEEQLFRYKVDSNTASNRKVLVSQIVDVTLDLDASNSNTPNSNHWYVTLYDLSLAWADVRGRKEFSPPFVLNSEGFLVYKVQTTSKEALEFILKASLTDPLFKPDYLTDNQLKEALNITYQVKCSTDIQRRVLKEISRKISKLFPFRTWKEYVLLLNWIMYGIEEIPVVLWIIEYSFIVYRGNVWYTELNPNENFDSPGNLPILRGKGKVRGLCYTVGWLNVIRSSSETPDYIVSRIDTIVKFLTTQTQFKEQELSFGMCQDVLQRNHEITNERLHQTTSQPLQPAPHQQQPAPQQQPATSWSTEAINALTVLIDDTQNSLQLTDTRLKTVTSELDQTFEILRTDPKLVQPGLAADLSKEVSTLKEINTINADNLKLFELLNINSKGHVPFNSYVVDRLRSNLNKIASLYSKLNTGNQLPDRTRELDILWATSSNKLIVQPSPRQTQEEQIEIDQLALEHEMELVDNAVMTHVNNEQKTLNRLLMEQNIKLQAGTRDPKLDSKISTQKKSVALADSMINLSNKYRQLLIEIMNNAPTGFVHIDINKLKEEFNLTRQELERIVPNLSQIFIDSKFQVLGFVVPTTTTTASPVRLTGKQRRSAKRQTAFPQPK